ncbi:glycosyltransferase [Haladaptatus sp. GCM10025707]|uniref:glycosyltransferase n=1 Tax=Haladaptatus sp. GCM10025707 TaxID=3252658 RepID=UPI003616728B
MAALSVLLPVAADTASSDFSRAFKSIQEQTIEPAEILLVTNQSLPRPLEASIKEVVDANNPVRHEHFPNAPGLGGVLQAGLKVCSEPIVAGWMRTIFVSRRASKSNWRYFRPPTWTSSGHTSGVRN